MVVKNLGWIVAAGLACVLAWSIWSRPPELTESQKDGLEMFDAWVNPDSTSLLARNARAHNAMCERSLADSNLEAKRLGVYEALESLNTEFDRRQAGGELTEELVSWYEAETNRTDAEIVARWKPAKAAETQ